MAAGSSAFLPGQKAPLPTIAVVGNQFCAPYPVALTVTKKALSFSQGDFVVTDVNGGVVMRVQGAVFSVRDRRVIVDAAGAPVVTLHKKVLSLHDTWCAFAGDSTDQRHLLFTVKRSSVFQMLKTELDVFLSSNTAQQICDFKVKGSYFERSCSFFLGNSDTIIAGTSRKYTAQNILLGKDTFGVQVNENVDYAFIVAVVVIIDELHRERHD